jgi:hypothetical protein
MDSAELEEDSAIAIELQKKVKDELHYSERRLVALAAYFKARALGMNKGDAEIDAARSMNVGVRTIARWRGKYKSEGAGFFTSSRWGTHSKTPYLLADITLQKEARMWVREHAARNKDANGNSTPNMKVEDFQEYLNRVLIPKFVSAWGETVNFENNERHADGDGAQVGAVAEASATQNDSEVHVCAWGKCHVAIGTVPPGAVTEHLRWQPPKDAHVLTRNKHLRSQSLKAALRQQEAARKAGKAVQYASLSAVKSYLNKLGFSVVRNGKSSFVDGHEREDVIVSRIVFLETYF